MRYRNTVTGVLLEPSSSEAEEQLRRNPAYRQCADEEEAKPRKRKPKEE